MLTPVSFFAPSSPIDDRISACVAGTSNLARRPPRVFPLTREERDEIIAMLVDGKSVSEIVDWIGCSVAQVRALMRDVTSSRSPEERIATATSPALNKRREIKVLEALSRCPCTIEQLRRSVRMTTSAADHMLRRLERDKRVRRLSGGRHMPALQKACVWALAEAEA